MKRKRWRTLRPIHEGSCHLYHILEEQEEEEGDWVHWLGWKTVETVGPLDRYTENGMRTAQRAIDKWKAAGAVEQQED